METPIDSATLMRDAYSDAKKLVSLEIQLLRAQAIASLVRAQRCAFIAALSLVIALPAVCFLGFALSEALIATTSLVRWQSYLIVFGVASTISAFCFLKARSLFYQLVDSSR